MWRKKLNEIGEKMDRIIRCITSEGAIMAAAIDSTYIVATAQQIHNTSPTATAALGRLLTGASLMGSMLKKTHASVTIKVNGGGPSGTLVAIADGNGNCRGYMEHPEADVPLKQNGKLDVGGLVGANGLLGVIRDLGEGEPHMGQVPLRSGEIAEDLTGYYADSEQIPTVCALGVLVDKADRSRVLAGGMLIQLLPGALPEDVDRLEKNIAELPSVTTMLAQGMTIEEMCAKALQGFQMEILDEYKVGYACTCSKERVQRALLTLPPKDILTLADEKTGIAEVCCQYCGKKYILPLEELKALADTAEKKAGKSF